MPAVFVVAVNGGNIFHQEVFFKFTFTEQEYPWLRLDLRLKLFGSKCLVANKLDLANTYARSFDDLEEEQPLVKFALVHLDINQVVAASLVHLFDSEHRLLQQEVIAWRAGGQRHGLAQLLIGDHIVAGEVDAVDDLLLFGGVGNFYAPVRQDGGIRRDLSKSTQSVQGRDVVLDHLGIEGLPGGDAQVVADLLFSCQLLSADHHLDG